MNSLESEKQPSKRILTPATLLSVARPILAGLSVYHLSRGKTKLAAIEAAASGITDFADGKVARWTEKHWSGWGVTEKGAMADQGADTAALAIGGIGLVASKRVHPISRVASAIVTAHEGRKVARSSRMTLKYRELTGTKDIPTIPSSLIGKVGIGLKQAAEGGAAITAVPALQERPVERTALAISTLIAGLSGAILGEAAGIGYDKYFDNTVVPNITTANLEA